MGERVLDRLREACFNEGVFTEKALRQAAGGVMGDL